MDLGYQITEIPFQISSDQIEKALMTEDFSEYRKKLIMEWFRQKTFTIKISSHLQEESLDVDILSLEGRSLIKDKNIQIKDGFIKNE